MEQKAWISYAPALVISIAVISVAGILGGPIAAAIAAFLVLPTLIGSSIVTFIIRMKYRPTKLWAALTMGMVIYVLAAAAILLMLNFFGPSQIM